MPKLMLMFPGQGSQYVGMGRTLLQEFPYAKDAFEEASSAINLSLSSLCLDGPEDALALTQNQQPCILTVSVAIWRVLLKETQIKPSLVAGHSLGEYSALVATDRLAFADAVRLVRARGLAMQSAVPQGLGAMAAVLGYEESALIQLCEAETSPQARVEVVNFNSPVQQIISGHKEAVERVCLKLKDIGISTKMLPVSAPFHSSLMAPAREHMAPLLDKTVFRPSSVPIIPNIFGEVHADYQVSYLVKQIDQAVLWTKTMAAADQFGAETYLEVGPGRVLFGLARRLLPKARKLEHTEDLKSIISTLKQLN